MSELIPEKGVCRIVVENTDKDDYWLNGESDVELYEIINVEDSDAEEDKHKRCKNRRGVKRKSGEVLRIGSRNAILQRTGVQKGSEIETYFPHLQLSHAMESLKNREPKQTNRNEIEIKQVVGKTEQFSTVKRFKKNNAPSFDANEESIMKVTNLQQFEVVEKTGLSQSYLQMTDAVKKLTEGLRNQDSLKGSSSLQKVEDCYRVETSPQCCRTMQAYQISKNETITSLENEKAGIAEYFQTTSQISDSPNILKNPLRTFRLNRNEDRTASHLHQCKKREQTEPSYISLHMPDVNQHVTSEELEFRANTQDRLSDMSCLQMSDDAINVKMAAEALSLLKNKGRPTFARMEEYVNTGPHTSVQISDAANCTASLTHIKKRDLELSNTLLHISPTETNAHSCTTLEPWQTRNRMIFDSTLEITDATTGAKIPFELLYLNNNRNGINGKSNRQTTLDLQNGAEQNTFLQLSDTVTCVKVPVESPILLQNVNSEIERIGSRYATLHELEVVETTKHLTYDTPMPNSHSVKCDNISMKQIINEKTGVRFESLQRFTNVGKYVVSETCEQTSDSAVCCNISVKAVSLPKNEEKKEKLEVKYGGLEQVDVAETDTERIAVQSDILSIPSTYVKIPLDAVHLPKYAATGVKIPFEYNRLSKNEGTSISKAKSRCILSNQQKSNKNNPNNVTNVKRVNNMAEMDKVNSETGSKNPEHNNNSQKNSQVPNVVKTVKVPTPIFIQKEPVGGIEKTGRFIPQKVDDTENIKLPLEPRLRANKRYHSSNTEEVKEIRKHQTSIQLSNTVDEKINPQRQKGSESMKLDTFPQTHTSITNNDTKGNNKAQLQQEGAGIEESKRYLSSPQIHNTKSPKILVYENTTKSVTNMQHQNKDPKPTHSTYPKMSNNMESNTFDDMTKQKGETKKPESSHTSFQVENIIKNVSTPKDTLSLIKKEDIKKHKISSEEHNVENSTSTKSVPLVSKSVSTKSIKTTLDAFSLLINDDMIQRILKYTNVKIARLASKSKNRYCFKKPTTENELKAFLGLLLISGALKQNNTTVPEIWSECFGAGIYRATLHEPRFHVLAQSICFGDNTSHDKCIIKDEYTRIGNLWEEYLDNCKKYSVSLLHFKTNEKTPKTTNVTDENGDNESAHLYSTARKTVNMPLRILFSMLDGAGIRGVAIFRRANPTVKMCHREFLKQVGMSLVRPHLRSRLSKTTLRKPTRELIESILNKKSENDKAARSPTPPADNSLKKQKRCQLCAWNKDRKTKYQCESCQRAMCKEHRTDLCVDCVKDLM